MYYPSSIGLACKSVIGELPTWASIKSRRCGENRRREYSEAFPKTLRFQRVGNADKNMWNLEHS